jgi:hypothetical protein
MILSFILFLSLLLVIIALSKGPIAKKRNIKASKDAISCSEYGVSETGNLYIIEDDGK